MVETPKAPNAKRGPQRLPGVDEEKGRVINTVSGLISTLILSQLSAGQVIDGLRDCCIAHLSCHDTQKSWTLRTAG